LTRIDVAAEKERLRRRILNLREQQTPREVETKSLKITETLTQLPEYRKARVIASYVDKGNEVQTRPLIRKALASRKNVLVPIVNKERGNLDFSEIKSLDELVPGAFDIPEPKPDLRRLTDLETMEVVLVPGIAWDFDGYRVGWGKGYFDTVLKRLPDKSLAVGLAFDLQVVDRVPRAQFDLPVDMVVTETKVVRSHHD
jgi:5-formyltetrahydrofolate cyclo-ligase